MTDAAWVHKTLGEVILLQRGFDLTERTSDPGPYPVISSGGISYTTATPKVAGPGVVTGRKGVLGKVHFSEGPYWPHDTTLWVKDFKGNDPRYVYYLLNTLPLAHLDAGASNPTLNRNHAHLLPVHVPDVGTQRKIAVALASLDDLIENNRRRIEILDAMARLVYREWFVHFRFPGHDGIELVDSDLGPIPKGWTVGNLFDVADVGFGFSFKSPLFADNGPYAVVRIRDIPANRTVTYTEEYAGSRYEIHHGDTLIGMDGDFHMCRWADGLAYLNQRVARVRATGPLTQLHVHLALEDPIRHFNQTITGTTVAHLGKRHLQEISFPVPDGPILERAADVFQPIFELEIALRKQVRALVEARGLLLPRLISGDMDVAELDLHLEPVD